MTGELAAGGARAVLFGTGRHVAGSELAPLPSVDATLDDLQQALVDVCGMAPERVTRVPAHADSAEVIAAVEDARHRAVGPVLLSYVGHGLLGPRDELYLATHDSRSARHVAQAVPYRTLRDLLGESPHGSLVVLDCCFSGRGTAPPSDGGARRAFATARPPGSFLLSSASHFALSFAPESERHTLFTGRLLRLLREGDPAGPLWLTADSLHAALDRAFGDDMRVRPGRQSEGTLGSLVLARNRAYAADAGPAEPPADVPCPYPGLEPFRAEDSAHFFGREELAARLVDAVEEDTEEGPVVLIGASGAGKSSLLRAGLLARLETREASARRPVLLLSAPGEKPMSTLAEAWAAATGHEVGEVRAALDEGRFPGPRPGRPPCRLLLVDQFEEVFTRCHDPREREAFIALLSGEGHGTRPRLVLGLRADHYGSCLDHPGLEPALTRALTVPPMREPGLRAAVEAPAAAVGLTLEPGLTDRLLQDLREGRGTDTAAAMPLLAHALRETWRRRSGVRLTLAGYQATGGIWESVATTSERLHSSLDEDGQRTLRKLLLLLVYLPEDGGAAVVRHRVPLADLPDGAREVRDRLARDRLLTVDQETAQIAHEALLRAWPRLRDWIQEDAATLLVRQRLRVAAEEWDAGGRKPEFLYRGSRLQTALELGDLPVREREFLRAGAEAADRERRREARRRRVLRRVVVALVLALCVMTAASLSALWQWRAAEEAHELATQRALLAEADAVRGTDPGHALDLGLAAYALRPSADARRGLFETLSGPYRGVFSPRSGLFDPVLSPDGRTLASSLTDELRLWDVSRIPARDTPLARLPCRSEVGARAAFGGPDGRLLAAACGEEVTLWDVAGLHRGADPRRLAALRADDLPGRGLGVALSEDGTRAAAVSRRDEEAAGGDDGVLVLWDLSDPRLPRRTSVTENVEETKGVVFSPDGATLLTVSETTGSSGVRVWDVSDPGRPEPGDRVSGSGRPVVFSPGGDLAAVASFRNVKLIDVTSPREVEVVAQWHATARNVEGFAFAPDGARLASGHSDGTATVWNLSDLQDVERETDLGGHGHGSVEALVYGADGRSLVSVGRDEAVHWEFASPHVVATIPSDYAAAGLELSPDGSTLAVNHGDKLELWKVSRPSDPEPIATLPVREGGTVDLAFDAEGTLLAGAYDGAIELWDVTDPARARVVGELAVASGTYPSLAFAPDAPLLAVLGHGLRLWDVSDPAAPSEAASLPEHTVLGDIAFSPDGRHLLVPELQGGVSMWDTAAEPAALVPLSDDALADVHSSAVFSADGALAVTGRQLWDVRGPDGPELLGEIGRSGRTIHPAGTMVASTSTGSSVVSLWSVAKPGQTHPAGGLDHRATVWDVVFGPDGRTAFTSFGSGVYLWDLGDHPEIVADTLGRACRIAEGGFTSFEWRMYIPEVSFRTSCR